MRLTRFYAPTLKETPSDAEVASHQLMLRAGMIRLVTRGIFELLPLGLRVIRKIENIVREEMNRAGANEVLMPMVQPKELWEETGRWQRYIDDGLLGHLKDRTGRELGLAPTAEEVVTDMVRKDVRSYKELPLNLYQINWKFRDEIRPRFGVMRGREFLMKDAYSFDKDQKAAYVSYQKMYDAYKRIFARAGLESRPVEAATGAIGGNKSHEFQVLAETGEDAIAACSACDYAANIELAEIAKDRKVEIDPASLKPMEKVATPDKKTIAEVAAFLNIETTQTVKTLVFEHGKDDSSAFAVVLIRGDHSVNEEKLKKALGATWIQLADEIDVFVVAWSPIGFVGPRIVPASERVREQTSAVGFVRFVFESFFPGRESDIDAMVKMFFKSRRAKTELPNLLRPPSILADYSVQNLTNFVVGANEMDHHLSNANHGRDFSVTKWADLRLAQAGDRCPRCAFDNKETGEKAKHGVFAIRRGIEVGHVFYLGTKYSSAMKAVFKEESGKEKPFEMGCYGIGITRVAGAAIEQNHDKDGIVWPTPIAPFQVLVLTASPGAEVTAAADKIYEELLAKGADVLYDDRDERAGFKFKDADLIGIPYRIVVGEKNVKEGGRVETKVRRTGTMQVVPPEEAVAWAIASIAADLKH